jgi:UDP-N-acetylmuramoyl-tripeptide--D-alanyl-D-alanine ligase
MTGIARKEMAVGHANGGSANGLTLDYPAILAALADQEPVAGAAVAASPPRARGITGASIDSRTLSPGEMFVALPGSHAHGARFLAAAFAAGAPLALVARGDEELIPAAADRTRIIWVNDARAALAALARAVRQRSAALTMVCVTGSYGKTTTKEMVAAALSSSLRVHKTPGNYNNDLGVPLTLLGLTAGHQAAVVELGMNAPGEIRSLAALAAPHIGVVTGVGRAHLAGLGSKAAIIAAKLELADFIGAGGRLVVPADDPELLAAARQKSTGLLTVSAAASARADLVAAEVELTAAGTRFVARGLGLDGLAVELATPARVLIVNALLALAVGRLLDVGGARMAAALARVRLPARRLEIRRAGGIVILDDCYNANPESMAAALATLRDLEVRRRIGVLGDMRELGAASDDAHAELGTRAADSVDRLYLLGDQSPTVARSARAAGLAEVIVARDRAELIRELVRDLEPGDGVLVKASRALGLEAVVEAILAAPGARERGEGD